jgi:DNA polymerase-3 subunit delta
MSADKPGFNFLICPDSMLLRMRLEQMASVAASDGSSWERHVYWGDEEPQPVFWDHLTLGGMFNSSRMVIVRQAHLWTAATWKKISQALARPLEQCRPFFCLEVKWEKGKPKLPAHIARLRCYDFAEQRGWTWRHEGLTERSIEKYVRERARVLGLSFASEALEQFCASAPTDAGAIENELQKFALLCGAQDGEAARITVPMVAASALSLECDIFACIRHMEAGNLPAARKELARSNDSDNLFFRLLVFMERDFRLFWRILAGEDARMHPSEANFKRRLAQRLGHAGVAEGLGTVMDAEYQVKSGCRTTEQSLDFLVASLTGLFRDS